MLTDRERELFTALKDAREALCGAMRVIAQIDVGNLMGAPAKTHNQAFVDEMHAIGLRDGFGVRIDAVLQKFAKEAF